MDHLGAPGHSVPSSLYVQRAVRHQPVMDDHSLFVQRAVRASQLESALRQAVVNAGRWASLSAWASMGPWPLAPLTEAGPGQPLDAPANPDQPETGAASGAPDVPPASATADSALAPGPAPERAEGRAATTASPGFRSQLENGARWKDQRPLTWASVRDGRSH
ncbi:hypothetical protein D9M69_548940 [compost metagenome]